MAAKSLNVSSHGGVTSLLPSLMRRGLETLDPQGAV